MPAALWSGVSRISFNTSTAAPCASNASAAPRCPASDAKCNGVSPSSARA
eukprot:CAMPEP_0198563714 /NCGR_PEP_ID=MMETSP1462-20131121/99177_1 /TAXON_ID=1333877 /ORGANISM="Brandtodinium nutriculum, Strain RCC3387" /LENGTH=49 /DNA_ID= /DNA_START= /DNA_END= /DNA_ORIENTATION=